MIAQTFLGNLSSGLAVAFLLLIGVFLGFVASRQRGRDTFSAI